MRAQKNPSARLAVSSFLSYPPRQQFETEMANFVPDKKGWIISLDGCYQQTQRWYTLQGSPQTTGYWQTDKRTDSHL